MLARSNRLTSGEDFRRALREGRRAGSRTVVVHLLRTESRGPARVGFAVSRAVGGAVVRNRVKRQLRHAMRSLLASLPSGGLVVVRALPEAATSDYPRLADDLGRCVSRAAEDRA